MIAIHSTWTRPKIREYGGFFVEDFEILTTILSALKWREKNGRIKMITDTPGYEFYSSRGMVNVWDEISTRLDEIPQEIDAEVFWAAGKLFALSGEAVPVAVIDTDFIVWEQIDTDKLKDLTVIHREELTPSVYPDRDAFEMKAGYRFPEAAEWKEYPANAAFYVIKNRELKNEYTCAAAEFMENAVGRDRLIYMVFAEQRLLMMTAKRKGAVTGEFSRLDRLLDGGDGIFTHIWGMKRQLRKDRDMRYSFCRRCIDRINTEFPKYSEMLFGIAELRDYFTL